VGAAPADASGVTADAPAFSGRTAARATRWSGLAVVVRQGAQLLFAVLLARWLGPAEFGVVSLATIYATLMALLLDQGLSSAYVQRRTLPEGAAGAVAGVNLVAAVVLGLGTAVVAAPVAGFFDAPGLVPVLHVLAAGLVVKGAAVAPRAVLTRRLDYGSVAAGDVAGAVAGAGAGLAAALLGAGALSVAVQVLVTDAVVLAVLLSRSRGPVPSLRLAPLRELLPTSAAVFASNAVAQLSRNTDNVLVGRFLGTASLAHYAMAYRVLVVPVQFIGLTVKRVLFPAFSRMADDRAKLAATLVSATELLSFASVPLMVLLAVAAPQLVQVVLGPAWAESAPLMTVLALAGARETIFYITPSLLTATGRAGWTLRFELVSTAVQVAGILAGLPFGILGVAVGYACAGLALTPVLLVVQRRTTGVRIRDQLAAVLPAVHASAWAALAYLLWRWSEAGTWTTLLAGSACFAVVLLAVLLLVHRSPALRTARRLAAVVRR